MALVSKAKTCHVACIKEAEANCASALAEAEDCCSIAIREAESQGASQVHQIQQSHAKDMQHLETEAINEERTDHLAFLAACSSALEASPPETHGIFMTPFHLLLGNAPMSALFSITPEYLPFNWRLLCKLLLPLPPEHLSPSLSPSGNTTCLTGESPFPNQSPHPKWLWMKPSIPSGRRNCPSIKS